jgi:hypothetical protein
MGSIVTVGLTRLALCTGLPAAGALRWSDPGEEDEMGFMDKAKKLAEQAQEKLDEAQQNINKGQSGQPQQGGGVRYDEHGRPIEEGPPAGEAPPPSAQPPETAGEAPADAPAEPPKPSPKGGADSNPDPFKPIQ